MPLNDVLNNEGTAQNGTADSLADADNGTEVMPPQHLFSDYVEIAYLGLVICAGLALNISVLKRLMVERRRARRSNKVMSGFLLLKLNLNVSDILILLIHASGKLGWLITYDWRGGDALCRLFNLLSMFTLYLSSNIVICIALDRLFTVLTAQRMDLGQQKLNLVRLMLTLAWTFSLLFSLPQLFVWTTYNPFKDTTSRGWVQCTDIWSIDRYERYLSEQKNMSKNVTEMAEESQQNSNSNSWSTTLILKPLIQNIYELSHLFLVFYGPLTVLVFCYVIISSRLIRFAANNPCTSAHTFKQPLCLPNNDNLPPAVTYTSAERRQLFKRSIARTVPSLRICNSAKWRCKSHCNNQQLNLLNHVPLMDILELSSTKMEEPSNCGREAAAETAVEATTVFSTYQNQNGEEMPESSGDGCTAHSAEEQNSSLVVHASLGNSAISLPIGHSSGCPSPTCASAAAAAVRPSASFDQLGNGTPSVAVPPPLPFRSLISRGVTPSHSRNSISCCSSSMSSSHDLKRFGLPPTMERRERRKMPLSHKQTRPGRARRARILYRIRDSFRESFSKSKLHRRTRLDDAELTNSAQCLSTNSLFDNCTNQNSSGDRDQRDPLPGGGFSADFCGRFCCPTIVQWVRGRMKRTQTWTKHEDQRMSARNSMTSSIGGILRNHCAAIETAFDPADITLNGSPVPPTPHPRPPSSATGGYSFHYPQQNGDVAAVQSVQKSPWFSRNHSVRSSYSTTISAVFQQNGKCAGSGTDRPRPVPSSGHFLWRHRSRAFRTTLLVILVHILLWSPYNVYALMKHVNERLYERMNEQANVLKDLQFLITLINPFLYGFGRSGGSGAKLRGKMAVGQQRQKGRNACGGADG
ncbi:hypothetical protein niasHT_035380 [Heterodera trifolii]|uniref:G-protein coupled receptors family 1 profile domain-containing protein n=1 Tax=Heterodera trifolii TaxID=157864 RepID=A0ABD2HZ90_9BILA